MYEYTVNEDMNYEEFADYVEKNFMEVLGEYINVTGAVLKKTTGYKDNIGKVDALCVKLSDEMGGPVIYPKSMFKDYQKSMEACQMDTKIAHQVLDKYAKDVIGTLPNMFESIASFHKRDIIMSNMENLHMCIISYEKNKEMLQKHPHRRLLDMAVVYRILLSDNRSFRITNGMIEERGITEEDLYAKALHNLEKKVQVRYLHDFLTYIEQVPGVEKDILVLTSKDTLYGASVIWGKHAWEEAANRFHANFFILPSSIHECLAIPDLPEFMLGDRESCIRSFHDMVREVNNTTVDEDEILTYSVYYYDRHSGEISILMGSE